MKKLMRKTAIFLLVAIMLMSSVILSFASTNQLGLSTDYGTLAENTGSIISNKTLNKDGSKTFTMYTEAADITSYITQINQGNGDIIYKIVEGDKKDEITIKQDGSLYLDGVPVTITKTSNGETKTDILKIITSNGETNTDIFKINQQNGIEPYAQQVHTSLNPPSGTTSQQFSDDRGMETEVITFAGKLLNELTVGAFGAILTAAGGGMGATIGALVATALYNTFKGMNPTANALSIKNYTYWHYNAFNCSTNTSAEKHFMYYYAFSNFTSLIDTSIFYRIWTY